MTIAEEKIAVSTKMASTKIQTPNGNISTPICPKVENNPLLRIRSMTNASASKISASKENFFFTRLEFLYNCSPFVSLTILSAICLLFVPNEYLNSVGTSSSSTLTTIMEMDEEFCCGGGPFSYYAASLISITCDRHQIHLCCEVHDFCYDQKHLNQTYCDDQFCDCLNTIQTSAYCETIAHPGLCLATRVFGHLFYTNSNASESEANIDNERVNSGTTARQQDSTKEWENEMPIGNTDVTLERIEICNENPKQEH